MPKNKKNNQSESTYRKGVMMILSPAKTLDLTPYEAPSSSDNEEEEEAFPSPTMPSNEFSKKSLIVAKAMKSRKENELVKLLGISAKLGETAYKYWSDFDVSSKTTTNTTKPAMFAFDGPAYKALSATTCTPTITSYLQQNLRIIDPLYGLLCPMDLIQPYRLEMATKKVLKEEEMDGHKGLAQWWSQDVTSLLSTELENVANEKEEIILVNLASDEYSSTINPALLPKNAKYIKTVFQTGGRVASVHAKRARGLMARYIAEQDVVDVEGLKGFDLEGYSLVGDGDEDVLVFDREKAPPKAGTKAAAKTKKVDAKKTTSARKRKEEKEEESSSSAKSTRPRAKRPRRKTKS